MLKRSLRSFWRKMTIPAAIVFLMAGFAGYGLYTLVEAVLDRSPPIDYLAASAAVSAVPQGGTIDVHFDVYRHRICPIEKINRYITDAEGIEHAVSNYTVATSTRPGREVYDRTITVPEAVPPGPASYRLQIYYTCNFVHNLGWPIKVESPSVHFEVTPAFKLLP